MKRLFKGKKQDDPKVQAMQSTNNSKTGILNRFKFRNVSIGLKYLLAFSIAIALFIAATVVVFFQLTIAKDNLKESIEMGKLTNDLGNLALFLEQKDTIVSDYILVSSSFYIDDFLEVDEELHELIDVVHASFAGTEYEQFFANVRKNIDEINDEVLNSLTQTNLEEFEVMAIRSRVNATKDSTLTILDHVSEKVNEDQAAIVEKANDSMDNSGIILLVANVVSIIIGLIVMILISRVVSTNLKKVVRLTQDIADGNLNAASVDYEGSDEIGQLTGAVNALRANMQNVIHKVTEASMSVSASSEELTQSAREVKDSSEQMVLTMEGLAAGSETQANSALNLSEQMHSFVESVRTSQTESQRISDTSQEVLKLTSDGSDLMKQSVTQIDKIDVIVADAVQKVQGLDQQSDRISKLVQVVKDIADQTNLLALNAAIEAARAGEHGKGFAVVADEVRKLAEQVTNSVTEITNIVTFIQVETHDVVNSLNSGYKEVKSSITQIEQTGESFELIDKSISSMASNISEVANRMNDIATSSEQMNNLIGDIAAVSEESAAGVEQSSASTQQTSSSMDEVSRNADELSRLAEQLNEEISVFKL